MRNRYATLELVRVRTEKSALDSRSGIQNEKRVTWDSETEVMIMLGLRTRRVMR